MATGASDLTENERARLPVRTLIFSVAALVLLVSANLFATAYVSAERYIYTWDWSLYWGKFGLLGGLLRADLASALAYVAWSIGNEDYTVLPLLPLVPFELGFGDGRLSYILAITNAGVVPSALLMAWVAERTEQRRSWARFLVCTLALLCLHVLWAPALRGLPDVLGVVIACAVLLAYFGTPPEKQRPLQLVGIGLLLCLLFLTRRWYLFWVVSFFPAALLAHLIGSPREGMNSKSFRTTLQALAITGIACGICLVILAAPLIARIAATDYAQAYAAYGADLAGGRAGQIVAHFGLALLALCAGGLALLIIRPATRELGIFLVVQAAISMVLFWRVQGLLGVQHYYLIAPAAGIGISALIIRLWNAGIDRGRRAISIAGVFAVVLGSSVAALSPVRLDAAPLLPGARFAPLVRPDLAEIDRLMSTLETLKPKQVYVAASSEVLNWGTLQMGCRVKHPDLCARVAVTADIDARDGFPRGILEADHVVVATPTQYHVRPEDQQVVGLLARDIRERRGIGVSFERLPGKFELWGGVDAEIYRRVRPLRDEDVRALSDELARSYPRLENLFAVGDAAAPLR